MSLVGGALIGAGIGLLIWGAAELVGLAICAITDWWDER